MIFCDYGIVLRSRPLRENDRIVTIFTKGSGKLEVNFKSVRRAVGKLKALSEPATWGDYRFYLRTGSNFPVCTGGTSLSVFPGLRGGRDRIFMAFHFCEVLNKLTPAAQANAEKYELLLSALKALDAAPPGGWMRFAFVLRVMELAGYGLKETSLGLDSAFWDVIHGGDWLEVSSLPPDAAAERLLTVLLDRFFTEKIGVTLRTTAFL
jgi:DNA repair protein RecO (recombination protein O)